MIKQMLAFVAIMGLFMGQAQAGSSIDGVTVSNVWTTPSLGNNPNGAIYLTIENTTRDTIELIAAHTPRAERTELHTHTMKNGIMKMSQIFSSTILAGVTQEFKPGGLHVMVFDIHEPLKEGEMIPLTLTFRDLGDVTIEAVVKPLEAKLNMMKQPDDHSHEHEHHHH